MFDKGRRSGKRKKKKKKEAIQRHSLTTTPVWTNAQPVPKQKIANFPKPLPPSYC